MKKLFALLLCFCMAIPLVACGEDQHPTEKDLSSVAGGTQQSAGPSESVNNSKGTDTDRSTDSKDSKYDGNPSAEFGDNLVLASDYYNRRLVVYNLDLLDPGDPLELAEEWSKELNSPVAGLKYREDTVFGDVIILSPGIIISYPEGKVLFRASNPGANAHSVEILPNGNLITANSTGGDTLRLYYTSHLLNDDLTRANRYTEVPLTGAHGALWDPGYEVLWALGDNELKAYDVIGDADNQTLVEIPDMGVIFDGSVAGGHDLAPDYSSKQHLYLTTNTNVFRFDKETNELSRNLIRVSSSKLDKPTVKGFGNNANGNFFYCYPNQGIENDAEWKNDACASFCTDTIYFCYWKNENFFYSQKFVSQKAGFYKVRVFDGRYQ